MIIPCLSTSQVSAIHFAACDEPEIQGCGKAQAMIGLHDRDPAAESQATPREGFHDTDVLHYDLDIEVSNLISTGIPRATLDGRNTITIQSKVPNLTEFTIRLRFQYEILSAMINDTIPVTVTEISDSTRVVTLDRSYGVDEIFTLTIEYTGESWPLGFGSFKVGPHGSSQIIFSLSEPYYSYSWWR